jgi:gliding motility-associated-like protein
LGVKNGDKISVSPLKTSTYSIFSTTIPNGNCSAIFGTATIVVNTLTFEAKTNNVSCNKPNDGAIFINPTSGISPYIFNWSNGVKTADNQNLSVGKYTLTISDANGCSAVATYDIKGAIPISGEIISEGSCRINGGALTINSVTGGNGNYTYSTDGTNFKTIGALPFKIANLAAGNYTVFINDGNQCTWSQKAVIPASAPLKVTLGEDLKINFGDSVALIPNVGFKVAKTTWSPMAGITCNDSICQFPSAKPKVTTLYKVVVSDANGCTATDNIYVFVNKPRNIYIPTAFSPNGDGNNDLFRVFLGDGVAKVVSFRIFNRWGNLVYEDLDFTKAESLDINRGWNGTYKGELQNPNVFIYHTKVEFTDGKVIDYQGEVMLLEF